MRKFIKEANYIKIQLSIYFYLNCDTVILCLFYWNIVKQDLAAALMSHYFEVVMCVKDILRYLQQLEWDKERSVF